MITSPQIEPVSTEHLLTCLGLAIDEAKLVRSIIKSKDLVRTKELRGQELRGCLMFIRSNNPTLHLTSLWKCRNVRPDPALANGHSGRALSVCMRLLCGMCSNPKMVDFALGCNR